MRRSFGDNAAPLATGALLSACGLAGTGYPTLSGNPREQALSAVMRLSHPMPPDDVLSWVVEEFARSVRERSEERLKVYVYPNSQLVRLDERLVDAGATGRVETAIIPGRYVEKAVPAQAIESLPFIFNSWDGFKRLSQDEEFRNTLNEEYRQRNLGLIDWNVSGWGWCPFTSLAPTTERHG